MRQRASEQRRPWSLTYDLPRTFVSNLSYTAPTLHSLVPASLRLCSRSYGSWLVIPHKQLLHPELVQLQVAHRVLLALGTSSSRTPGLDSRPPSCAVVQKA
eukprot:755587-Hanusia_phi.AAC.1